MGYLEIGTSQMSKTASLLENNSRTRQVIEDLRKNFQGQVTAIEYRLGADRSGDLLSCHLERGYGKES